MDISKIFEQWALDFEATAKKYKVDMRDEIGFWLCASKTFGASPSKRTLYVARSVLDHIERTATFNLASADAEIRGEAARVLEFCASLQHAT